MGTGLLLTCVRAGVDRVVSGQHDSALHVDSQQQTQGVWTASDPVRRSASGVVTSWGSSQARTTSVVDRRHSAGRCRSTSPKGPRRWSRERPTCTSRSATAVDADSSVWFLGPLVHGRRSCGAVSWRRPADLGLKHCVTDLYIASTATEIPGKVLLDLRRRRILNVG